MQLLGYFYSGRMGCMKFIARNMWNTCGRISYRNGNRRVLFFSFIREQSIIVFKSGLLNVYQIIKKIYKYKSIYPSIF